jgi:hypothetical protein
MPRIAVVPADTPFGERLQRGFGYPLHDAALPTCVVLALSHYVALLPSYVGVFGGMLVWAATWRYAAECLLHSARGYADPPDVGVDETGSAGWGLTAIHLLVVALCVLAIVFFPHLLLPLFVLAALVLPAIDMSMAFDGDMALALNPLNWFRIAAAFGAAYLVPVAINLLLAALILLASLATAQLPALIALPLFAFAYSYLIVLGFHLMGGMIHQRHERFGVELQAEKLAAASGQDADQQLLQQVERLAGQDIGAATALLAGRLQDRHAPAALHQAYRELLQRQHLREGLLVHGQIWIAALMAGGEARRALGLVQECSEIDADFLPDDPRNAGELAELAARSGINRLALKLCRGFLATWPRDFRAPQIGLYAARMLRDAGQATEAAVLLAKLAAAWPGHPLHDELLAGARPPLPHHGNA